MTFQTPSGFTQIDTDSGTATITNTKPNTSIVGDNGITTSASGSAITVDGTDIGLEFIQNSSILQGDPAVSSVEFINLPTTRSVCFLFQRVRPVNSAAYLTLEFSSDNGATWETSGYASGLNYNLYNSTTLTNLNSTAHVPLTGPLKNSSTSGSGNCYIAMFSPDLPRITGQSEFTDDSSGDNFSYFGAKGPATNLNAFRVLMSSGDIEQGLFTLYSFTRATL